MTKTNVVILIPPSEGKTLGGVHAPLKSVSQTTSFLLKEMLSSNEPGKLYGVKGTALAQAIQVNKEVLTANTKEAVYRYSGVVYNGIDFKTLKNKEIFNQRVQIVSGLFGLVKPDQLIPNYKFKIEKLKAATLWLPINTKALENVFVIDLLPQAHKKAIRYINGVEVEFVIEKTSKKTQSNGVASAPKRVPAGHAGKYIKGKFIRFLIENDITDPKDFSQFNEDGFKWIDGHFLKRI